MVKRLREKGEKYPSSESLLNAAMNEYSMERGRANDLDSKASFFMTLGVAIATIFIPIIPLGKLSHIYLGEDFCIKCVVTVFVISLVLATCFILRALLLLYNSFKIRNYKSFNAEILNDPKNYEFSKDTTDKSLCQHYQEIIDFNLKVNDEKAAFVEKGMRFGGFGFLALVIGTVGLLITID